MHPLGPPQYARENQAFYEAKASLTRRYMPTCRQEIRALRSKGKQPCLPHHDEIYAYAMAQMRAQDAMRHGVREDITSSGPQSAGGPLPNLPTRAGVPSLTRSRKVA